MSGSRDDAVSSAESGTPSPRRGPRPGGGVGREQILQAATEQFGERGYQATTIRRIGDAAGVDSKLVHYYFGTKEDLFTTAIAETFRSHGFLEILADHPLEVGESPGTRYLLAVLTALEDPGLGPAFIGLVRNLGTHEESRRIFLRFVNEEMLGRVAPRLQRDQAETRLALAGTQLLGLILARYVLRIQPLTALSIEEVATTIGPNLDRYILGDLDIDR